MAGLCFRICLKMAKKCYFLTVGVPRMSMEGSNWIGINPDDEQIPFITV